MTVVTVMDSTTTAARAQYMQKLKNRNVFKEHSPRGRLDLATPHASAL
jgi:hypothetical protein